MWQTQVNQKDAKKTKTSAFSKQQDQKVRESFKVGLNLLLPAMDLRRWVRGPLSP